ncbi:XRE family transcriptional regulator [Paraburkholderia sp. RP-4-7]|jgi:predicted XRE-type DNA-binding protein|uniref:XRE family transcriptional regulator n=1 Tax=Paraburkholderia polaris TaxID=2728848 RepID=A0A848IMT4_9BURK|nr:XRE family transcriptional regulator [Paraburkholderia polaris]
MSNQTFSSVWDAIEDTPEQAQSMKLRSVLMMALKDHITRAGMSQAEAARHFYVTQPRVSDLMRGKINLFSLDALVNMAVAANMRIEMRVSDAPAKRTASNASAKAAARKKPTIPAKKPAVAKKPATKAPARRSKSATSAVAHAR